MNTANGRIAVQAKRYVGSVGNSAVKRRLFNFAAALSLLLCVAACVLWVRSLWYGDCVYYTHERNWVDLTSAAGYAWVTVGHAGPSTGHGPSRWRYRGGGPEYLRNDRGGKRAIATDPTMRFREPSALWRVAGIEYIRATYSDRHWTLFVPYVWLFVASAALPALWMRAWLRDRHRRAQGLCPNCGYDVRESSDRCPECGELTSSLRSGHGSPTSA